MPDTASPTLSPARIRKLRSLLLDWYDKEQRALPWRAVHPAKPNAYHVLVSEAMLQQTQVATVIAYFQRFTQRFPTVTALASADEQDVLKLWQGLGYYRRARNLHAAARVIVDEHDSQVPTTVEQLLKLPGVGRYTAGAIASIAHGTPAPILDGNVARVLARWFAIEQPIDDAKVRDELWTLAEALVPRDRPGDFNQAMMELGALICSPKSPGCLLCPIANHCDAHSQGLAQELPRRTPRKQPQAVTHLAIAITRRGDHLLQQRPATGLWSNMWQLPTLEGQPGEATPTDDAIADWCRQSLGLNVELAPTIQQFTHQTTHRTITFVLREANAVTGRLRPNVGQWRNLAKLDDLPLPNPQRKMVKLLQGD